MSKDVTMTWVAPTPLAELVNPASDPLEVRIVRRADPTHPLMTWPVPLQRVGRMVLEFHEKAVPELPRVLIQAPGNDDEHFNVRWSAEDGEYVGTCEEFPSLSHLATTPERALSGIQDLVTSVRADLAREKPAVPE